MVQRGDFMGYEIRQRFLTDKPTGDNRPNNPLNAKGCVLHSTANQGATDENHFTYFENAYRGASAHVFIDWDSITQIIPWDERAWHAGATANTTLLGIELCEPKGYDPAKFREVWNRGVWCFAHVMLNICGIRTITPYNLPSHKEISDRYPKETNHQDPVAYFKTYGKTVDMFRAEVQEMINTMLNGEVINVEAFNGTLKVTATTLNIRTAPNTTSTILGTVANGELLTGVGKVDGWYKVIFAGTEAYASGTYLEVVPEPTPEPVVNNDPFLDWANVADWAKPAVAAMKELGIMSGEDGNFNPQGYLTREQAAKVIYNTLKVMGKV